MLQGVSKKSTEFCFANFSASETSWKLVLYIFQQPSPCRIQKWPYFYSRIKIGIAIDKKVVRIPHLKRWVLRFQPIWWLTFVFTFSRLPRHFKKEFYTIFNSLGCAESKDNKIFILGLELVNVLPKVYIGITFVQIECNLVIICYKVNLLYIIPPILILEYKYCYFLILLRLDCWELYKTICQGVMEAKKLEKKCASIWMKPHYSPF